MDHSPTLTRALEAPITYKPNAGGTLIAVHLHGKKVGHITKSLGGMYHYAPVGGAGFGSMFKSLAECKQSLESA